MRIEKTTVFTIIICISTGIFTSLSGCINCSTILNTAPPVATGHVYLDGNAISGATVEAMSIDGTDYKITTTDKNGAYILNITPAKMHNITARYQGLQHTVWPVYLDNESDTYNINLTTTPRSTIEGTGRAYAGIDGYVKEYKYPEDLAINLIPITKNYTTLSKRMDSNYIYSIEIEPDIQYTMKGTVNHGENPADFFYHNIPSVWVQDNVIMVGSNETALINIEYYLP